MRTPAALSAILLAPLLACFAGCRDETDRSSPKEPVTSRNTAPAAPVADVREAAKPRIEMPDHLDAPPAGPDLRPDVTVAPARKPADMTWQVDREPTPTPAPLYGAALDETFFGLPIEGRRVGFLITRSGGFTDQIAVIKEELRQAVDSLDSGRKFLIVFHSNGPPAVMPPGRMVSATPENKQAAREFINPIILLGSRDLTDGIPELFAADPDVVYVVTYGEWQREAVHQLSQMSTEHGTKVNIIHFYTDKHAQQLIDVADRTGGTFLPMTLEKLVALVRARRAGLPHFRPAFFGPPIEGRRIAFLCARTGGMREELPVVKAELKLLIGRLRFDREFLVVFYTEGRAYVMPQGKMVRPTEANREIAFDFIDTITPVGSNDPEDGLRQAFAAHPDAVYFLTVGEFDRAIPDLVAKLDPNGRARMNVISLRYEFSPDLLRRLARHGGGSYRHVTEEEFQTYKRRDE